MRCMNNTRHDETGDGKALPRHSDRPLYALGAQDDHLMEVNGYSLELPLLLLSYHHHMEEIGEGARGSTTQAYSSNPMAPKRMPPPNVCVCVFGAQP